MQIIIFLMLCSIFLNLMPVFKRGKIILKLPNFSFHFFCPHWKIGHLPALSFLLPGTHSLSLFFQLEKERNHCFSHLRIFERSGSLNKENLSPFFYLVQHCWHNSHPFPIWYSIAGITLTLFLSGTALVA